MASFKVALFIAIVVVAAYAEDASKTDLKPSESKGKRFGGFGGYGLGYGIGYGGYGIGYGIGYGNGYGMGYGGGYGRGYGGYGGGYGGYGNGYGYGTQIIYG